MTSQSVFPTVRYRNTTAAIDWLVGTLGFVESLVHRDDADTIDHAQLAFGSSLIMVGPVGDDDSFDGRSWIYLVDPAIDSHYERALAAQADVVQPIADRDYGSREYTVRDPEGNLWSVGTYQP